MKLCLVIAEDDGMRAYTCGIVSGMGMFCAGAESAEEAFIACQSIMPDVILVDDSRSAASFISRLRDLKKGMQPVVISFLPENGAIDIRKTLKAGANAYLVKPVSKDSIGFKFRQLGLVKAIA